MKTQTANQIVNNTLLVLSGMAINIVVLILILI
jgi:hypothetical protein